MSKPQEQIQDARNREPNRWAFGVTKMGRFAHYYRVTISDVDYIGCTLTARGAMRRILKNISEKACQ